MEILAQKFKDLINEYKEIIVSERKNDSVEVCEKIRSNPKEILKTLLIVKVTKGYWRDQPIIEGKPFSKYIDDYGEWSSNFFLGNRGRSLLIEALSLYREAETQYANLKQYLFERMENDDIINWIKTVLDEDSWKNIFPTGQKSWNIFLRDAYDYKYIPIDMHERRF